MDVTGKPKSGEAGRKVLVARADVVADIRASGISWYGIARELNERRVPGAEYGSRGRCGG
jgi:hypothetical protein